MKVKVLRWWVLLACLAIMAFGMGKLQHVTFNQDLLQLLPADMVEFRNFREAASVFEPHEQTFLVFHASSGHSAGSIALVDRFADELAQSSLVNRLDYKQDMQHVLNALPLFTDRPSLFYKADDYSALEERLNVNGMKATLSDALTQLKLSPAPQLSEQFYNDPLQLLRPTWTVLKSLATSFNQLQVRDERLMSADGKSILMIAKPKVIAADSDFATEYTAWIDSRAKALRDKGIKVSYLSGHRFSALNAKMIREDVERASTVSLVGLVVFLLLVFRRKWFIVLAMIPLSFASLLMMSLLAFWCTSISLIALSCGLILMGVAIDYALHFLYHLDDFDRIDQAAVISTVQSLWKPLLVSGLTTTAAFACLLWSHLPLYKEYALISIVGLLCSLFATFLALAFFPLERQIGGVRKRRAGSENLVSYAVLKGLQVNYRNPWVTCTVIAVATVGAGWSLRYLNFSGDLQSLYATTPESAADVTLVEELFGSAIQSTSVVIKGEQTEAVFERAEAFIAKLKKETITKDLSYQAITDVLPSANEQEIRYRKWQRFWSDERLARVNHDCRLAAASLKIEEALCDQTINKIASGFVPLTVDDLATTPFAPLLRLRVKTVGSFVYTLISLPRIAGDVSKTVDSYLKDDGETQGYAVSTRRMVDAVMDLVIAEFKHLGLVSLVAIALMLLACLRWRQAVIAATPIALSLVWTLATLALLGYTINLMNCVVGLLVVALTVDYSVFLSEAFADHELKHDTRMLQRSIMAIGISVLTTVLAVGSLALANHPALHSVAITILLGTVYAVIAVSTAVPALSSFSK